LTKNTTPQRYRLVEVDLAALTDMFTPGMLTKVSTECVEGLPADATLRGVWVSHSGQHARLNLVYEHESFSPVLVTQIPKLEVLFQRHHHER
jgi:hypothetical protein